MILRFIYTLFLGIFVAIFVGVGIAAFYPEPKFPDMPPALKYCSPDIAKSSEAFAAYTMQADQFDKAEKAYQQTSQLYNKNVSIITIIASIILVVASLTLFKTILLIADGLLLGGVLTLLYSMVRGFGTDDNMFRFIAVSIGLTISLILGYVKFIRVQKKGVKK